MFFAVFPLCCSPSFACSVLCRTCAIFCAQVLPLYLLTEPKVVLTHRNKAVLTEPQPIIVTGSNQGGLCMLSHSHIHTPELPEFSLQKTTPPSLLTFPTHLQPPPSHLVSSLHPRVGGAQSRHQGVNTWKKSQSSQAKNHTKDPKERIPGTPSSSGFLLHPLPLSPRSRQRVTKPSPNRLFY